MMDNLSPFQERILDKLYGPLGPTDNKNELDRVCLFYRQLIETLDDKFIHEKFHEIVGHKLYRVLKQKEEFYYLDRFKIHYKQLSEDFVLENIDATETDFIHKYLDSQKEIIDKTFTYIVKVNSYPSLEVVQFVEKDFFYEFILSSRKKIKFLEEKLKKISSLESEKKNTITKNPQQLGIDKSKNDVTTVKKVKDNKRITIRDKKVHLIVEALNLEIDFLRDDILPKEFVLVLIRQSDKNIHLNIDNGSFHYLITKLNEFFYNLTMSNVARTNKICSYKGTIISVKNLLNSKSDNPKLKDSIDRVFKKFE